MIQFKITWALFEGYEEHKLEFHTETVLLEDFTKLLKYVFIREKSAWHTLVSIEEVEASR